MGPDPTFPPLFHDHFLFVSKSPLPPLPSPPLTSKEGLMLGLRPNRPSSRYLPSLPALKDRWDENNVMWFLRGQTSGKNCQWKKSR